MPSVRRRLFIIASAVLLLLCVATVDVFKYIAPEVR
jgi:hypothetical protein